MSNFVFDCDGTVAEFHADYLALIKVGKKNWPAFNQHIQFDKVIEPMKDIINALFDAGHNIILLTARSEECRDATSDWFHENDIPYHKLYMRKQGDMRPDDIIKSEEIEKIEADFGKISMVFDDRKHVCQMFIDKKIWVADVGQGLG